MINQRNFEDLLQAIEDRIRRELRGRCEAYAPDFRMPEVFSALTALLARQAALAIEFVSAPQLWNSHSAPLFLRAMADVHITLSWILLDPNTRARKYIDHGLGQAKLELEHRKSRMESADEDSKEGLKQIIQAGEAWINVQRWHLLVEVNVGAWSGKTTREMAEEAGIIDFYNTSTRRSANVRIAPGITSAAITRDHRIARSADNFGCREFASLRPIRGT